MYFSKFWRLTSCCTCCCVSYLLALSLSIYFLTLLLKTTNKKLTKIKMHYSIRAAPLVAIWLALAAFTDYASSFYSLLVSAYLGLATFLSLSKCSCFLLLIAAKRSFQSPSLLFKPPRALRSHTQADRLRGPLAQSSDNDMPVQPQQQQRHNSMSIGPSAKFNTFVNPNSLNSNEYSFWFEICFPSFLFVSHRFTFAIFEVR